MGKRNPEPEPQVETL
jgi:hypothetical protein